MIYLLQWLKMLVCSLWNLSILFSPVLAGKCPKICAPCQPLPSSFFSPGGIHHTVAYSISEDLVAKFQSFCAQLYTHNWYSFHPTCIRLILRSPLFSKPHTLLLLSLVQNPSSRVQISNIQRKSDTAKKVIDYSVECIQMGPCILLSKWCFIPCELLQKVCCKKNSEFFGSQHSPRMWYLQWCTDGSWQHFFNCFLIRNHFFFCRISKLVISINLK